MIWPNEDEKSRNQTIPYWPRCQKTEKNIEVSISALKCSFDGNVVSRHTVQLQVGFCFARKVCFFWVDDKFGREELLSALGMIVEIDGCKIGK